MGKIQAKSFVGKTKMKHTTRKKPDRSLLLSQVLTSVTFIVVGNEQSNEDKAIFLFFQCVSFINLSDTAVFDSCYEHWVCFSSDIVL